MMFYVKNGMQISKVSVENYLGSLVNKFFKILPMRENSEVSLQSYCDSLQRELIGFGSMVPSVGGDKIYVAILSVLQYFTDNIDSDELSLSDVRSEVFHAISLCNKLKDIYKEDGGSDDDMG